MGIQNSYKMIGLMSGTSGDGLDVAFCEFTLRDKWSYQIGKAETIPFPPSLRESLTFAHRLGGEDLAYLDVLFGKWMGQNVRTFCEHNGFAPDAIASHGHTVFHQPDKGFTLQIGNGWALHQASGWPVINDFRTLDVMLGGQGAPLVPIGDRYLFSEYDFCLNLGGIANISMETFIGREAFDISPFNLLLNFYAGKKGLEFDDQGRLAESGSVIPDLLDELEELPLYHQTRRKSLGREDILTTYIPLLDKYLALPEDFLSTLVEHFSRRIGRVILSHSAPAKPSTVLVTGGGAYNRFFIRELFKHCGEAIKIIIPEDRLVDFKEALIFAFLGVLRMRKENNCLKTATSASKDSCGGTLYGFAGMK